MVELAGRETSTKAPSSVIGEVDDPVLPPATDGAVTVTGKVEIPVVETVSAAVDETEGEPSFDSALSCDPCFSPPFNLTRDNC